MHGAVVLLILTSTPVPAIVPKLAPLMVDLLKPEQPVTGQPKVQAKIVLPKPLPVNKIQQRTKPEPALLSAQSAATTAVQAPPPLESAIAASLEARPAAATSAALAVPSTPPAPVIPPNFTAGYLHNPAPVYPILSRRMGEEGRVLIRVFVEADGAPQKVELRSSSGSERLDQSALDAVRRWKFAPAKQGDRAVAAWVVVPVVFSLKG